LNKQELRTAVIESLQTQGFSVNGHITPAFLNKQHYRKIQSYSKKEQLKLQKQFLDKGIKHAEKYLISGRDICPEKIDLELRLVEEGSMEETLYRWWNLIWWSMPYQRAYGRQMRFLLWDKAHNAPFGLIGLQSPILKMSVRDEYLKIPKSDLDYVINQSMQAQRIGALPPYNQLLGGKMVALSLSCNELREAYKEKYKNSETVLEKRIIESNLLFITTTSAFGRSSIYNRLNYNGNVIAKSLGYTQGSGSFHISEEIYKEIQKFLKRRRIDTNTTFGYGPSRKVKLLSQAFSLLGLTEYEFHNLKREFFLFPIAKNIHEVINKKSKPLYDKRSLVELQDFWKQRWCIPRSHRYGNWQEFEAKNYLTSVKRNITRWTK
jgi:hypothetical protein